MLKSLRIVKDDAKKKNNSSNSSSNANSRNSKTSSSGTKVEKVRYINGWTTDQILEVIHPLAAVQWDKKKKKKQRKPPVRLGTGLLVMDVANPWCCEWLHGWCTHCHNN